MDNFPARMNFPDKEEAGRSSRPRPTHEIGSFDRSRAASCVTDASGQSISSPNRSRRALSTALAVVAAVPTCAHFSCELPATDSRRGMPLCRGHFFIALQWEQS